MIVPIYYGVEYISHTRGSQGEFLKPEKLKDQYRFCCTRQACLQAAPCRPRSIRDPTWLATAGAGAHSEENENEK